MTGRVLGRVGLDQGEPREDVLLLQSLARHLSRSQQLPVCPHLKDHKPEVHVLPAGKLFN